VCSISPMEVDSGSSPRFSDFLTNFKHIKLEVLENV
jgi:hypothetical protein